VIELATMSSVCPDWSLTEILAGMKKHGYKGLEPRVEWDHVCGIEATLTADQRREVRDQVTGEGLEICCLATSVRMAAPEAEARTGHVEDLRKYIDLAADLGCGLIRTFGGPRATDRQLAAIVEYVAEGYSQILEQASSAGVTVLMETHDDWSCSAPVRAVVEKVDSPSLRILWDVMHPQRMMERPQETFVTIGGLTEHLHAHDGAYVDGQMKVGPLGEGVIDHATPLKLLGAAGFDGFFSVEVIHSLGSEHDAEGVLRQYAEGFRSIMG